MSFEARVILAAINSAMVPRLDPFQGQIGLFVAGQMTTLQTEVGQLGDEVRQQDQWMTEVESEMNELKAGERAGTGTASSRASLDEYLELMAPTGTNPPLSSLRSVRRTVWVIARFLYDMEIAENF